MKKKPKNPQDAYLEELMNEVDANVRELVETFRFILKYIIMFKGSGVEFSGLREYVPLQDDASKIDWKASLRSKKLYVKQFEDERDLDVYILLDTSSSMLFGTQEKLKSEYAAVIAGTLAYAAVDAGDNLGFAMFGDHVHCVLDPVGDITQYYKILKFIVDPQNYGGGCNMTEALSFLVNIVADRTILFVVSDFIGLSPGWEDGLRMMAGKVDRVVGLMVRDVRDDFIPKGTGSMRLADPFTQKVLTVDLDKVGAEFERLAKKQEEDVKKVFIDGGMGFVKIYTNEPFARPLINNLELTEF
jgi:uncharacterized protein (DUF58 family)